MNIGIIGTGNMGSGRCSGETDQAFGATAIKSQSRRPSRGGRQMSDRATNPMALRDFKARLHGELILPDEDGYDSARRV